MNNRIRVLPYKPGHMDCMSMKPIFNSEDLIEKRINQLSSDPDSHIRTLLMDNTVLGIVGLKVHAPGIAEVWSVTSNDAKLYPIGFHKAVSNLIEEYEAKLELFRISMTVKRDFEEGHRWAESLGFQLEGHLRSYMRPGEHYLLFARVKNG